MSRIPSAAPIAERLARLRSRGQVYGLVIGVMTSLLVVSLALPFVAGNKVATGVNAGGDDDFLAGQGASGAASPLDTTGEGSADTVPLGPDGVPVDPTTAALASAGTPRPGQTSPSAGSPGGGATGGSTTPTVPRASRTASDQGITANTVKIGVIVTDLGGTSALGFEPDGYSPSDQQRFFQVHIDDINKRGGLGGRKVEVVYDVVDILDPETMRAACRRLGQDQKVFAVLHILGVYGDPILCFTQQQKLPYLAWDGAVSDYYGRSNGLLITTQPSTKRTSLDMVKRLRESGELAKKVGILRYAEYLDDDMKALIAYTRQQGVEVTDAEISVSNIGAVPSQLGVAVNRFQAAGVTQVLLMTNTLYGQQFVAQAERQQFLPAYAVSDFDYASAGHGFLSDMPDSFFTRGRLVTATRVGEERGGKLPASVNACLQVASAAVGQQIGPTHPDFFDYLPGCGLLKLLSAGFLGAGDNPTRPTFAQAVTRIGSFDNIGFGASSFKPGKLGGSDVVRLTKADLGCRCWIPVDDFRTTGFGGS